MARVESQLGPNLVQNLQTFRTVMTTASGLLFWVPIVLFVSVEHSRQNFYTLTRILIPLLIFYFFIFFIKNFFYKTLANLSIYVTFYLFLIFFGNEVQSRIIPFGIIYLASIILISFGLKLKFALPSLALILILEYITVAQVGDKLILGGAIYSVELFILYHFIIALVAFTFTNTLEKELNFIDQETLKFANDNRDYKKMIYQRELLRNLRSKIHGTLLNNLSLISQNRFKVTSDRYLENLKEDLSNTKFIESEIGDISLADIFSQALKANPLTDFSLQLSKVPEVFLPRNLALDLNELLVEVLRNIHRHAGAKAVLIDVFLKHQKLFITINDDGIGPESINSPKLGLSNAIFETLHALDGKILYSHNLPTGTTTKIEFPVLESISLKNLSEEELTRRIFPTRLKLTFLLPHFVLAIYFLIDPVVQNNPLIYLLHAIASSFLFFSLFPDIARAKPIFPTLFLLSSLVLFWQVSKIYQSCVASGGWHWIITTYSIGFIFYLGFQKNKIIRWMGLPIFLAFMYYNSFSLPNNCSEIIRLPLFNSTIAGIGFGLSLIIFYKQVSSKIKLYETTYKSENLDEATKIFLKLAKSDWNTNPETGIELIARVTKDSKLLENPEFIQEAKVEQARLRSLLTIDPLTQSPLNEQIIEIIKTAALCKNIFELEFHGSQEHNPGVPEIYFKLVKSLVKVKQKNPIQAKIFSNENQIQISLIAAKLAFDEVVANIELAALPSTRWALDTEEIVEDNQEKIWFMISTQRTSDELARYAQTSNTQITNQ